MDNKFCFHCKILKSKKEFYAHKNRGDGCSVYCKECSSEIFHKKYNKTLQKKICLECKREFLGFQNSHYCSKKCGLKKKRKPLLYKHCLVCDKEFPYIKGLITSNVKRDGVLIAGENKKYCSHSCNIINLNNYARSEKGRETSRRLGLIYGPLTRGIKHSAETRKRHSEAFKGEKSHFWKGGVTKKNRIIRSSVEFPLWREAIFKRDNWTCQECGVKGGRLHAHHVKPFSQFPELRFNVSNGLTLCEPCHKKTDTYFGNYHKRKSLVLPSKMK